MTDQEYAARIYCLVFNADDDGDAYMRGILRTIGALGDREQVLLESHYRLGMTYKQIGEEFCLSNQRTQAQNRNYLLKYNK